VTPRSPRSGARGAAAEKPDTTAPALAGRRWPVALLLALHAALAIWGAARNSVTFDENFHLPAGVALVARGYTAASVAQPPLVKALAAIPALAAGARVPPDSLVEVPDETKVGEAFMRLNADRYVRVYFAARMSAVALSLVLGLLVWHWAGRRYGPRAALLALAVYALLPETLAHAGLVGMDLPTGLMFLLSVYAFERFAATGAWAWWVALALSVGAAFLTRFSAVQLGPILILLYLVGLATGQIPRRVRVAVGLLLLPLTSLLMLHAGYLGQTTFDPLSTYSFHSPGFRALQEAHPGLRPPLPDAYVGGLDYLLSLAQTDKPSYLLGTVRSGHTWYYFPLAIAFKWPLAFFALLLTRVATLLRARRDREWAWRQALLLLPVAVGLGSAMSAHLEFGVRSVFPLLPFLCVWLGGGLAEREAEAPAGHARVRGARAGAAPRRAAARIAMGLVAVLAIETATCAPWYLTFFNLPSGGPGGGDRLVNDSNVDWGQGLIALREELARRGIGRILLVYHGTTDPAIYGIDYLPYHGGPIAPGSEWMAVSSYFLAGLPAPMMTQSGRSEFVRFGFQKLRDQAPAARPAHCMYLYRLPRRAGD
jgi:hypothetical protein